MLDQRRSARQLVLKTGSVRAAACAAPVACAVLNISGTGACILVPHHAEIPDSFVLAIDVDGTIRQCMMVWRKGPLIGLEFQDCDAGRIVAEPG